MIKPFVIRITHVRFFRCDNSVPFGFCGNAGESTGVVGVLNVLSPSFDIMFPFVLFLKIEVVIEEPSDKGDVEYYEVDDDDKK